jgi:hypothetical protein
VFIAVFITCSAFSQPDQQKLTATILHLDSAFWNAYNNCDTSQFKNFLTDDAEFYHDKGGILLGADKIIEALNKNICGSTESRLRREAVEGTVQVYPMQIGNEIYGAIISGEHNFFVTMKGKPEYQSGVANFSQLWLIKNGMWKMARILSYNHHEPDYVNQRKAIDLSPGQLDIFQGTYKSAQSGTMTVVRKDNVLILQGGGNSFTLYPLNNSSFFTKERDLVFEFIKDASGKPVRMVVKERGSLADELKFENNSSR